MDKEYDLMVFLAFSAHLEGSRPDPVELAHFVCLSEDLWEHDVVPFRLLTKASAAVAHVDNAGDDALRAAAKVLGIDLDSLEEGLR